MRARRPFQRGEIGERAKRAVLIDGKDRERAARIVGGHQEAPGGINREMHAIQSARRLMVQQRQPAGFPIDPIRGGLVAVAVHRVEISSLSIGDQKRWILKILDDLNLRPASHAGAPKNCDAFAVPAFGRGEAADVHE